MMNLTIRPRFTILILFLVFVLGPGVFLPQIRAQSLNGNPNNRLKSTGLEIGSRLPDSLEVYDAKGYKMKVTDLFQNNHTVIVSGCLTCPVFLRTYPGVEAVYNDYREKVDFYYLYKTLAHPEYHGYVRPLTIEERLAHIAEAKEKLQTKIPWLADPMTNEVSSAFGLTPNSEFLFDNDGHILYMNTWSDAEELRKTLVEFIGPVDKTSTVESLNLPTVSPMNAPFEEVITRITVNETLIPIMVRPEDYDATYYVKLRAEVSGSMFQDGSGKLYLGFHLDPIHNVHWNNLVDPLKYDITVPDHTTINEARGIAPLIKQPSDTDPREFLIEVDNWKSGDPLPIEVTYYACDEDDKWCKLVVQNYTITLDPDPYAGRVIGRSSRSRSRGRMMQEGTNNVERMMNFDTNQDGLLSKDEVPERMRMRFDMIDANNDGFLSTDEIAAMRRR